MKLFFSLLFSVFTLGAFAQIESAKPGVKYGKGTTADGAIDVVMLNAKLAGADTYDGKVRGTITGVCAKKGCWMKLKEPNGQDIMVRFKDYKFFMPQDIIGKQVVLEGSAERTITSVAQLRHYAEDAGKSKEEVEKIKEDKVEVEFVATGVLVVG